MYLYQIKSEVNIHKYFKQALNKLPHGRGMLAGQRNTFGNCMANELARRGATLIELNSTHFASVALVLSRLLKVSMACVESSNIKKPTPPRSLHH